MNSLLLLGLLPLLLMSQKSEMLNAGAAKCMRGNKVLFELSNGKITMSSEFNKYNPQKDYKVTGLSNRYFLPFQVDGRKNAMAQNLEFIFDNDNSHENGFYKANLLLEIQNVVTSPSDMKLPLVFLQKYSGAGQRMEVDEISCDSASTSGFGYFSEKIDLAGMNLDQSSIDYNLVVSGKNIYLKLNSSPESLLLKIIGNIEKSDKLVHDETRGYFNKTTALFNVINVKFKNITMGAELTITYDELILTIKDQKGKTVLTLKSRNPQQPYDGIFASRRGNG